MVSSGYALRHPSSHDLKLVTPVQPGPVPVDHERHQVLVGG